MAEVSWNYRIIAHDRDPENIFFEIYEVYYRKRKGIRVPVSYKANPSTVGTDDVDNINEDITWTLDAMKEALDKPILSLTNFPKNYEKQ